MDNRKRPKRHALANADRESFPALEYLHIVGYFRDDIRDHRAMFLELLALLATNFEGQIAFEDSVTGLFRRSDRSRDNDQWTPGGDLQGRIVWYEAQHIAGTDIRATLASPAFLPEGTQLNWSLLAQEGRRASRTYRTFDHVWSIAFERPTVEDGSQSDSTCCISLATSLFAHRADWVAEPRTSTVLADGVVRTWLSNGPLYYAFMTSTYYREDAGGWSFMPGGPTSTSPRFCIEHDLWEHGGVTRRDRVRGVYSGQYLSPQHLAKLGGKESFVKALLEVRDRYSDIVTDLGESGLVLRLTPTPLDPSTRGLQQGCAEIASWVFRRFRECGLFL
jgi:hypothetical protein